MGTTSSGMHFPGQVRIIRRESIGWTIGMSILLIVLGLLALAVPFLAGIAVESVVSWLLIFGGIAHLVFAFHVRGAGAHVWEALVGIAYLIAGFLLFVHPVAGLVSLTLFLGAYLFVKGAFELIAGITIRGVPGRTWLFVDAVVSILLGTMIWRHLPYAAAWAVGTLLGVAVLFSGISRLGFALAARNRHLAMPL